MTKTRDLADLGGGFIQAGTGAVRRTVESKLQDVVSVLDFIPQSEHAAIKAGTSTYDATSAIQAAVNTGNRVYVPSGTYLITSTVTATNSTNGLKLLGEGRLRSIIKAVGCTAFSVSSVGSGNAMLPLHLSELQIQGDNTWGLMNGLGPGGTQGLGASGGTVGAIGLAVIGCDNWSLTNVQITRFNKAAFRFDTCSVGTAVNCVFDRNSEYGGIISRYSVNESPSDSNRFLGGFVQNNGLTGVLIDECEDNTFYGVQFVTNGRLGRNPGNHGGAVTICGGRVNHFDSCYFEWSGDEHIFIRQGLGVSPAVPTASDANRIINNNFVGTVGERPVDYAPSPRTGYDLNIDAGETNTYIAGNSMMNGINNAGTKTQIVSTGQSGPSYQLTDTGPQSIINSYGPSQWIVSEKLAGTNVVAFTRTNDGTYVTTVSDSAARRRECGIASISGSNTIGNNLRGSVTIANPNSTAAITFPVAETSASYFVWLTVYSNSGGGTFTRAWVSSKTASGFTINLEATPPSGSVVVQWLIIN